MSSKEPRWHLGQRIAPPRFIAFVGIFLVGTILTSGPLGLGRGTLIAFDVAAIAFLGSMVPLLRNDDAKTMRVNASRNDANRAGLLALTGLVMMTILVAVASELEGKTNHRTVVLVVVTLALAWLLSNTVYALHYAHLYYLADADGRDRGGLSFPGCDEPDYWDFVYFSFTLGMTFQTSDVEMNRGAMRRVATGHCLAAFVFNIGVLAFTINVLGGL